MTNGNTWEDWLKSFLYEYEPAYKGAYYGWIPPYGTTRPRQTFMESMYPTYRSRYLSQVYPDIKAGRDPGKTFEEFLGAQRPMEEFSRLPWWERGENPAQFRPSMRMLFR